MSEPLAYFITFTCYGHWLHGDERGSVDPQHNQPGTPWLPPDPQRRRTSKSRMIQRSHQLDALPRRLVLSAICEVCQHRGWRLWAAHVRSRHVHVVVSGGPTPEKVMNDLKSYASRVLNDAGIDDPLRSAGGGTAAPAT